MIRETYKDYSIESMPIHVSDTKWAVSAVIRRSIGGVEKEKVVYADDRIRYLLEIEAAREGINLGRNLIMRHLVGF